MDLKISSRDVRCARLLERFDLQIGLLREWHGRDQGLDHVRELGIVAPVWQVVLVQASRELDIAANGIDRFADSKANQRCLEFIAEISSSLLR